MPYPISLAVVVSFPIVAMLAGCTDRDARCGDVEAHVAALQSAPLRADRLLASRPEVREKLEDDQRRSTRDAVLARCTSDARYAECAFAAADSDALARCR
jgi:hypothetical protein